MARDGDGWGLVAQTVEATRNTLPIWNVKEKGLGWQQTMFQRADKVSTSAFYVAADVWTYKGKAGWAVGPYTMVPPVFLARSRWPDTKSA